MIQSTERRFTCHPIVASVLISTLVACSELPETPPSATASRLPNDRSQTKTPDEEKATAPAPVTGTYLYCENRDLSTDEEANIGCSLRDAGGKDIAIAKEFKSFQWTHEGGVAGTEVIYPEQPANSGFQMIYLVRSTDGQPVATRFESIKWSLFLELQTGELISRKAVAK